MQRHDPERFVTALFAPVPARQTLFTLYAFNHQLARACAVASQPMMALIRLQWWREVIDGADRAHEVATPLRAAIDAGALDAVDLDQMIQARMREAEEGIDEAGWMGFLLGTGGALMRQAGRVLGAQAQAEPLTELGAACAAVGLLRHLPARPGFGFPDGRDSQWTADQAARMLGPPRRWPSEAIAAALPAVFARRHLRRWPAGGPDPWARLAVWASARRGVA